MEKLIKPLDLKAIKNPAQKWQQEANAFQPVYEIYIDQHYNIEDAIRSLKKQKSQIKVVLVNGNANNCKLFAQGIAEQQAQHLALYFNFTNITNSDAEVINQINQIVPISGLKLTLDPVSPSLFPSLSPPIMTHLRALTLSNATSTHLTHLHNSNVLEHLTHLNLHNTTFSPATAHSLATLPLPALSHFDLSHSFMGPYDFAQLQNAPFFQHLRHLTLRHVTLAITHKQLPKRALVLPEGIEPARLHSTLITQGTLDTQNTSDTLGDVSENSTARKMPNLGSADCSPCTTGRQPMTSHTSSSSGASTGRVSATIGSAGGMRKSVTKILNRKSLTATWAKYLCSWPLQNITTLDLAGLPLDSKTTKEVASMQLPSLLSLNVSNTGLTPKTVLVLLTLQSFKTLVYLDMSHNPELGGGGLEALTHVSMCNLIHLNISHNKHGPATLMHVHDLCSKCSLALQVLDVRGNNVGPLAGKWLRNMDTSQLHTLYLDDNNVRAQGMRLWAQPQVASRDKLEGGAARFNVGTASARGLASARGPARDASFPAVSARAGAGALVTPRTKARTSKGTGKMGRIASMFTRSSAGADDFGGNMMHTHSALELVAGAGGGGRGNVSRGLDEGSSTDSDDMEGVGSGGVVARAGNGASYASPMARGSPNGDRAAHSTADSTTNGGTPMTRGSYSRDSETNGGVQSQAVQSQTVQSHAAQSPMDSQPNQTPLTNHEPDGGVEQQVPVVRTLSLRGNSIGSAGMSELAKLHVGAGGGRGLHVVDMFDNNMGAAGVKYLAQLNTQNITQLNLGKNDITDSGARALSLLPLPNLTHLNLSHSKIGSEGLSEIVRNLLTQQDHPLPPRTAAPLKVLDVSHARLSSGSLTCLRGTTLSHMETLNLAGNRIGVEGAAELACLSAPRLRNLDLEGCGLELNGTRALCTCSCKQAQRPCTCILPHLTHLNVARNGITNQGMVHFSRRSCAQLHTFNLAGNYLEGVQGVATLSQIFPHSPDPLVFSNLRVLDLSNNALGVRGISALSYVNLRGLRELHLANADVDKHAMAALCDVTLSSLITLTLSDNMVNMAGLRALHNLHAPVLQHLHVANMNIDDVELACQVIQQYLFFPALTTCTMDVLRRADPATSSRTRLAVRLPRLSELPDATSRNDDSSSEATSAVFTHSTPQPCS